LEEAQVVPAQEQAMVLLLRLVEFQLREAEQEVLNQIEEAVPAVLAVELQTQVLMVAVVPEYLVKETQEDLRVVVEVKTRQVQEQTEEQVILLLFQVRP
tara:strand:+ start:32 stop:328 length:297 start_codon:yes stop_codon:yes gene_type:complete